MKTFDLTVIITSFHSRDKIFSCIESIEKSIKIIVIENSNDKKLKDEIHSKYQNVECILSKENLGYGAGNNLGLSKVETSYALIVNPDVTLNNENIIENENSKDIVSVTTNKNSEIDHERDKMEDEISTKKQKFNIFSLKLPNNKEELIMNIDKFIPIGIVILTLFIAFVV